MRKVLLISSSLRSGSMKGTLQSSTSIKEFHDMKVSESYANGIACMANVGKLWCVVASFILNLKNIIVDIKTSVKEQQVLQVLWYFSGVTSCLPSFCP